ncbi:hypothetical protein DH2020_034235 [Rehmannia glutinosa]|uniref:WAT1-related protein n=1 Tax=Rehmannia glutinosa TaxID=99300 RepID=A0ABR0V9W4_REHGL
MGDLNLFLGALNNMKPYLAMIALQFGYAGMYIITLVSLKGGFSHWILVVYRHVVATLENKTQIDKIDISEDCGASFLRYTSATFASATVNVLPAITFILAVIFSHRGNAHDIVQRPVVDILWYSHGGSHQSKAAASAAADQHWVTGTIMLLCCIVGWSAFFILQNKTLEEYPAELSLTSLVCLMGMVEGGIVAVIMERHKSAWTIGFDSRLLAVVYSGIVCSGIAYYMQSVVNKVRGPVFVTAFSPLSMIITAVLGAIVLSEQVHLGSLIGAVIIVVGLYSVVWGKSKEHSSPDKLTSDEGPAHELPMVDKKSLQEAEP